MNGTDSRGDARPPLLAVNMRVPQLHGELIGRSALLEKLDKALRVPLTLITAPAGFGKTTSLVQWIRRHDGESLHHRVAWVSLERENDLHRFWRYVLTALDGVQASAGASARALLDAPQAPLHAIPTVVINEVSSIGDDFVLVLDDYHLVDDPSIHAALDFFVNHLPTNLHVILSSRSEPPLSLARWRASNRLCELREDDLRFSPVEVAAFLNETKRLDLSDSDVEALSTRTEGWIAGLQLVALSVQGYDDASKHSFVAAFTGNQRYIFDYLVTEVLQRQPENVRRFLLQTAILDRLSAALCAAVTGQDDCRTILAHLERSNMFTIPLDQERHWYRYHHLFRDVLRHRLQHAYADAVPDLHRRAAGWYIKDGQAEAAIHHACAAEEWDQAVELIGARISSAWNRGEIRRILSWLEKLPDDRLEAHPELSLFYSRALLLGGQMEAARRRLREAEEALRARPADEGNRVLLGTVCAFRTTVAAVTGETKNALPLGEEALSLLPQANADIRGHAINSLGVAHYYMGDMVHAAQRCAEARALAREAGNLYLVMVATTYRAKALVCQGRLLQAEQTLMQALRSTISVHRPGQAGIPAASVAYASYGALLYEWNRLEEAEAYVTEAIELGRRLAFGSAVWSAHHTLARIKLALGDGDGARLMLEHAQHYRQNHSVPLPTRLMDAQLAGSHLALGQVQAAERWERNLTLERPPSPGFVHEIEMMTLAWLRLAQDRPDRALAHCNQILPAAEHGERQGHVMHILALRAMAYHAQGETRAAIDALHEALALAQPEGYVRLFVDAGQSMAALLYQALASDVLPDYVNALLALFPEGDMRTEPAGSISPASDPQANERLVEPLTPREIEVLQLVADGASNSDIAEALTIAVSTAKKHVSNIINKLGVDNRTEAAAKGRQFGLCE